MNNHIGTNYNFKCRVCGEDAIGFYFGVFSCEACKVFFRRNALNTKKFFSCKHDANCHLNKIKNCSFCRLNKCLSIGMRKDMIKSKCTLNISKNEKLSKSNNLLDNVTPSHCLTGPLSTIDFQASEIEHFHQIVHAMSTFVDETKLPVTGSASNGAHGFRLIGGYIRSVISFCKQLDAFKSLRPEDQLILLKGTFFPLTTLRFSFIFDRQLDGFPVVDMENKSNAIFIKLDTVCSDSKVENIVINLRANNISFQDNMDNDVNIRNLMSALFLFNRKTGEKLSSQEFIRYQYFIYERLLQHYLLYKLNPKSKAVERFSSIIDSIHIMDFNGQLIKQMYSSTDFNTKSDEVWDEIFSP